MRIVLLTEELGIGGLPNYVLQLARILQKEHEPIVAYVKPNINPKLEIEGLNVCHIASVEDIKSLQPHIVHVHLLSDLKLLKGLFTLGVPLIRSYHDYTSTCLRRGKRRWPGDRCQRPLNMGCAAFGCTIRPPSAESKLPGFNDLFAKIEERNLFRTFDASLTGSRHMTGMLLNNDYDPARIHTAPYFSSFAEFAAKSREYKPGAAQTRPLEILFSGQAVKGKGLEILIESLIGLEGNWRLTVFSEGPRLNVAKEIALKHGLTNKISFNGWVSHTKLKDAYAAADVFVLPSIWDDPGPLVGIEALSMGTPVIGFNVGGIPDYVLDVQTGFLVKDISSKGLHVALKKCLDNPELLPVMGRAGQQLVMQRHTKPIHLERIQFVYDQVTANKKTR